MSKEANGREVVRLILRHFSSLRDPRVARTRKYALGHVLAMALCGVLMGADGFAAIALVFGGFGVWACLLIHATCRCPRTTWCGCCCTLRIPDPAASP